MFNSLFFDDAAASRNKRHQLGYLLRVAAPHERVILAGIGAVLLALLVWILFGSVVRSVTVDGVLLKPGIRHEVVSTEPGHLMKFLVTLGDQIEKGGAIARQTVPELEREITALRDQIEILEAGVRQVGGDGTNSFLISAQEALLQMEARRIAKEVIASHMNGEIMVLDAAPGDYLPAGSVVAQLRDPEDKPLQAVLLVAPRMAKRLRAGMQTSVEVVMSDGAVREVDGEIVAVTSGPFPNWLAAFQSESVDYAYRVDITLDSESKLAVPDGTPCHVRIMLGRHSPIALLSLEQI
ncbi:MAG: HlyD family efflux transporter periplasmic adaptor subunit [Gammaproteobacteria bacterium]|nr:HlyD family efflux transporter periplasmic adaptor subunit [Gammaproteobacteria bacterium]